MTVSLSTSASVLNCAGLFDTPKALRAQKAFATIIDAEADDTPAVGYVGLSRAELLRLMNGEPLIDQLTVRLTSDHPTVRHWASTRPGIDFDLLPRRDATRIAITDAWLRTLRQLILARAPMARVNRGLYTVFLKMRTHLPAGSARASLTLDQMRESVGRSRLLATGHNAKPGLRNLATALGVPWGGDGDAEAAARLESIFADVPTAGGARLALKASAVGAIRVAVNELPSLRRVEAADILAILANDQDTNQLLDEVLAR